MLDVRTLLLIFGVSYGVLTLIVILIWRLYPAETYTRDWALASVCGMASAVFLGLRDLAPDILSIVAGNALTFLTLGAQYVALRRFMGGRPHPHWYWSAAAIVAVLVSLFTYVWPSLLIRMEIYSLGQIAFCLPLAAMLWRPLSPGLRPAQRLLAASFGLLAVGSLAHAVAAPWAESSVSLMEAGPATALYIVLVNIAVIGFSVGWVMLVTARLQERLARREAEYRSVVEQMPDIFFRTNRAGYLTLVSPSAAATLGYASADGLLGQPVANLWHTPARWAELQAKAQDGPVKDFETVAATQAGGLVPVSVSCHYYTDESGAVAGLEGIIRDTTEHDSTEQARRHAEEALREEHAQLARRVDERTAELRKLNAELTRALTSRDEFLAAMSHELRTPLTAILGQADMLREEMAGPLNDQQRWQAQTIYSSGQHLLDLINDVLDMARLMSGRLELAPGPVVVDELCQSCLQGVRLQANKKGLTLHYTPAPAVSVLQADGTRLKQILANLLSNAVKFTPEGGEAGLEVQADPERQVVRFVVWDTGIGIPADDMPRLFQHFVQLDSRLTRGYEGTGLGLALVKRLAELHCGEVSVESAPGQGSRFTVTLPWQA